MDVADVMGPRDFAKLLQDRYGLRMSHQAISKAPYLPRTQAGRILVQDALVTLEARGRISLDGTSRPPPQVAAPEAERGRPKTGGNAYYEELTLTEKVKRRKLEMELAEKEGRLLRVEDVTEAMVAGARKIGERLEQLTGLADDIVVVAQRSGAQGVRELLRRQVRDLRQSLAESLTLAAAEEQSEDEQG